MYSVIYVHLWLPLVSEARLHYPYLVEFLYKFPTTINLIISVITSIATNKPRNSKFSLHLGQKYHQC